MISKELFLKVALPLIVTFVSIFLGINPNLLSDVLNEFDQPAPGYARVLDVIDGDTIEVKYLGSREKVRFIGLDTPETHHPDKAVQCFGYAAHEHLKFLIADHDVRLEADPTNTNRDRYNRLLRYVYLPNGTLLNKQMILDGFGFAYTSFPFERKREFVVAQQNAIAENAGLWGECEIINDDGYFNTGPL